MDEAEYPSIRVNFQALFDGTITPLKLDVSTGDIITPSAIQYDYKLMFEDRYISLFTYNLETVLAEKLETVIRRHITNTRMRDFYDIYVLTKIFKTEISTENLREALKATSKRRGSAEYLEQAHLTLNDIEASTELMKLWASYRGHYNYANNITWVEVIESIRSIFPDLDK